MKKTLSALAALGMVAACSGSGTNPFTDNQTGTTTSDGGGGTTTNGAITSTAGLPPGTTDPTPARSIVRYEETNSDGGGYAKDISYNAATDEFTVDNLAFDGDNVYARSVNIPGLGPNGEFGVYEADITSTDPATGNVIENLPHAAIYGRSTTGGTEFAIVRTGGYFSYGFGGFVYQRNGLRDDGSSASVVLPTEGDAEYTGAYAGTKVFNGRSGQEFTSGEATMIIDFKDFNDNKRGVSIYVRNRRLYDSSGADITDQYLAAIDADNAAPSPTPVHTTGDGGAQVLPDIRPVIDPDIADGNGEIAGEVFTRIGLNDGTSKELDTGKYYAIISGPNADEIVGVVVIEGDDPRWDGVKAQETGGFIVYRQ